MLSKISLSNMGKHFRSKSKSCATFVRCSDTIQHYISVRGSHDMEAIEKKNLTPNQYYGIFSPIYKNKAII